MGIYNIKLLIYCVPLLSALIRISISKMIMKVTTNNVGSGLDTHSFTLFTEILLIPGLEDEPDTDQRSKHHVVRALMSS